MCARLCTAACIAKLITLNCSLRHDDIIAARRERYAEMIRETQRTIEQGTDKLGRLQQEYQQAMVKVSSTTGGR